MISKNSPKNSSDSDKPMFTPDRERITYLPRYFNRPSVPLKETSTLIPVTGFDKSPQALLMKPEAAIYIQTNTACNARCPNCLLGYKGMSVSKGCLPFSKKFFTALKFAFEHMGIRNCSITGGEPTLFKERLVELFTFLPKNLENITLFSNGAQLLSETSKNKTLLEALVSNGLTSLVLNCVHPDEKMRAKLIEPNVSNKEYYKIVELCRDNLIDVRLSWVFDNKDLSQSEVNTRAKELIDLGRYLRAPEVILRVPTPVACSSSREGMQSEALWEKCRKYLDGFISNSPKVIERSVKTRAYYRLHNSVIILEVYHEPKSMKTDVGTVILFSGANPQEVHMGYRWYNGAKSCGINYESKPWADRNFFRKPKKRDDPYKSAIRELG